MNNIELQPKPESIRHAAPEEWIFELLDSQLGTVAVYTPVATKSGNAPFFEIGYTNSTPGRIPPYTELQQAASPAADNEPATLYHQLLQVHQNGEKAKHRYHHPATGRYFDINSHRISTGILCTFDERTTEVEAEKEKEKQVDLVNNILNATTNGVFAMEALRDTEGKIYDFNILKTNDQFAALMGLSQEEIIGKSYLTLLPLSQENGLFQLKCQVVETGETATREVYDESKGKWLRISISRLGQNGIAETVVDITKSRQDRQDAERLAQKFHTVISTAQSGVHIFKPEYDEQGNISDFRMVMVNPTIAAYIGQSADTLTGALASTYFPAYKTNGLFDIYKQAYQTGVSTQFDFHYEDGYDVFFNLLVVKLGDELLVTLTDHTPLKRMQRELEASIAELKRSNASLEQFAHAASHDLQEPLRKIIVHSEKLLHDYGDEMNDNCYGILERIRTAGRRMHRLVQDLLVFAEVGANRNTFEEVDLNKLVDDVLNDLEVAITERDAQIQVAPLPKIKGDPVHLQQLFQNLISNALKYARLNVPPQISISAAVTDSAATGLPLTEQEKQQPFLQIMLCDNGQGFTDEEANQIFKIFQRLPQHRLEYSGTGIGLAIVQRVIENHRGYIRAKGIPGKGATFTIYLPAS